MTGKPSIDIHEAVRRVRLAHGDSQENFAGRLETGARSITRYECDKPPGNAVLLRLWLLAKQKHLDTIAEIFARAIDVPIRNTLSDPAFLREWAGNFSRSAEPALQALSAPDLTDEERKILGMALATLRSGNQRDRDALVDAVQDVPRLHRDRYKATFYDKMRRLLKPPKQAQADAEEEEDA